MFNLKSSSHETQTCTKPLPQLLKLNGTLDKRSLCDKSCQQRRLAIEDMYI
ncbi:hypothetical protein [Fischerella sp. PCC 9605]|uniref:hypothetical protein n=1 Tax=Fischerella sp. PCC 9605 TaxID=1173024 RepID=UPI0018CC67FB